jgi:hypothetical protein
MKWGASLAGMVNKSIFCVWFGVSRVLNRDYKTVSSALSSLLRLPALHQGLFNLKDNPVDIVMLLPAMLPYDPQGAGFNRRSARRVSFHTLRSSAFHNLTKFQPPIDALHFI